MLVSADISSEKTPGVPRIYTKVINWYLIFFFFLMLKVWKHLKFIFFKDIGWYLPPPSHDLPSLAWLALPRMTCPPSHDLPLPRMTCPPSHDLPTLAWLALPRMTCPPSHDFPLPRMTCPPSHDFPLPRMTSPSLAWLALPRMTQH